MSKSRSGIIRYLTCLFSLCKVRNPAQGLLQPQHLFKADYFNPLWRTVFAFGTRCHCDLVLPRRTWNPQLPASTPQSNVWEIDFCSQPRVLNPRPYACQPRVLHLSRTPSSSPLFSFYFEIGAHQILQEGLEPVILLPQPSLYSGG